ncbi:MAG: NADP-dependent oxidoreductase [Pseudomonadota bacterium]
MAPDTNRQILLHERPAGKLLESHFSANETARPKIGEEQVLVRTILLSLDAANRAWMQGPTYRQAVKQGDVMHGYAVAEVVESNSARFQPGAIVAGETGWQQYAALDAKRVSALPDYRPLSHLLSVLGIAGKTAYHGVYDIGALQAGETAVISAAAGSVGIYAGQLAKLRGARVVGIAGGSQKCEWLRTELGFDDTVDYKAGDLMKALSKACPNGIDVFFDNVGGPVLEAALFNMAMYGRVVCCGAVSQYDTAEMQSPRGIPGLLVVKRIRMEGFIVLDERHDDVKASQDLAKWTANGDISVVESVLDGLDAAPSGLIGLLAGENRGKWMVRVGPDPA